MIILREGKTNFVYILIIIILAAIVGGGVLWQTTKQEVPSVQIPEIKRPEVMGVKLPQEIISRPEFQKWLGHSQFLIEVSIIDNFVKKEESLLHLETFKIFDKEDFEFFIRPYEDGEGAESIVYSPDKSKLIVIYISEPDSFVYFFDLKTQQMDQFGACGTPCGFDVVFWLDNSRFVVALTSLAHPDYSEVGEESVECKRLPPDSICSSFSIDVYNLEDNSSVNYSTLYLPKKPEK